MIYAASAAGQRPAPLSGIKRAGLVPCSFASYLYTDFSLEKANNFTIRKGILRPGATASSLELSQKKTEFIVRLEANNSKKGYNLLSKYD